MSPREAELAHLEAALLETLRLNAMLKATIREIQEAFREMAWARVEDSDPDQPLRLHLVEE